MCQDGGVSLGELLSELFDHGGFELRDGGDPHLLGGGVLPLHRLQKTRS